MKKGTFIIINFVLLSSCQVFKTSTSKSIDIKLSGVIQKPTIVDLKVDEKKITASVTSKISTLDILKQQAISEAIKSCKCDIIVEPAFESIRKGKETTTTVSGYPGYYTNFRPMVKEDTTYIKIANTMLDKSKVKETTISKKRKIGPIIFGTLGAITVFSLFFLNFF
jgi:hypothetical protein